MKLEVTRTNADDKSTLGTMTIEGHRQCFTLEDQFRKKKVKGQTRIPAGTYDVKLRTEGGFHKRYGKRFPDMHKGMLELQDVPGFKYILIHCGNDHEDTAGCILVGSSEYHDSERGYVLRSSADAYKRFYPKPTAVLESGGKVTIIITDIPGEVAVDDNQSPDKKAT
ncbi:MAG: hypothetical protein COB49_00430 [Alphaproteobacteria bacterium]|nr:MAG: hypothetical protein COB49_00430 [Alphaproteobacteria bacterium]